jgi:hypothetical protein
LRTANKPAASASSRASLEEENSATHTAAQAAALAPPPTTTASIPAGMRRVAPSCPPARERCKVASAIAGWAKNPSELGAEEREATAVPVLGARVVAAPLALLKPRSQA